MRATITLSPSNRVRVIRHARAYMICWMSKREDYSKGHWDFLRSQLTVTGSPWEPWMMPNGRFTNDRHFAAGEWANEIV